MAQVYRGERTREISFPLGGIGTGCIGLAGNGQLVDWELMGRPAKGSRNGYTHFAIKAERDGQLLDARVLQADQAQPLTGERGPAGVANFGHGPSRFNVGGLPHFEEAVFTGEFPISRLEFLGGRFPGKVMLTAFNPFIPLDEEASSLPAAFFCVQVENDGAQDLSYTVALTLGDPLYGDTMHEPFDDSAQQGLRYWTRTPAQEPMRRGELAVSALQAPGLTLTSQDYWYRGHWFDGLGVYWRDFTGNPGGLKPRRYAPGSAAHEPDQGTVAATFTLAPGERRETRFLIAWRFPNMRAYWRQDEASQRLWTHHYAQRYESVMAAISAAAVRFDELWGRTKRFHDRLFASTLPASVLDAVSANLSILKTQTVLRLPGGAFYGWEGQNADSGSCEGSCTHVWNYAYALPFLFPRLERSMRDLDFAYNMGKDGGMAFRLQLPLGVGRWDFRPCADGQFGGVIKTYREWKISGDDAWLKGHWEAIQKNLAYAWSPDNPDRWDADRNGVLEGRQHHTLDMELFGPNAWLTSLYLAALKAASQMGRALGEEDAAREYERLFKQGSAWVDAHLFNGQYYQQQIDLDDPSILSAYAKDDHSLIGMDTHSAYWNEEAGELKYQIGQGCAIDQVLGQWHARLTGLGDILDPAHVRCALHSIYSYNFKRSLRDHVNPCRLYALDGEAGTVICEWPQGVRKPVVPAPYSEETMTGFEYQAAAHMILEGMTAEGLELVTAVRNRFDGARRNPWNEFECGSNYARSMASYALLVALSGFSYDKGGETLGFAPRLPGRFACFFCLNTAWGMVEMDGRGLTLRLDEGALALRRLLLPDGICVNRACLDGQTLGFTQQGNALCLDGAASLTAGHSLEVTFTV